MRNVVPLPLVGVEVDARECCVAAGGEMERRRRRPSCEASPRSCRGAAVGLTGAICGDEAGTGSGASACMVLVECENAMLPAYPAWMWWNNNAGGRTRRAVYVT